MTDTYAPDNDDDLLEVQDEASAGDGEVTPLTSEKWDAWVAALPEEQRLAHTYKPLLTPDEELERAKQLRVEVLAYADPDMTAEELEAYKAEALADLDELESLILSQDASA